MMGLLWNGRTMVVCLSVLLVTAMVPVSAISQDLNEFRSDEYGFVMKYPATWVKIDNPKGNYYKVFQAPDLTDGFRPRIHVAAHKPVKDSIEVFLDEMRKGIKDLQKGSSEGKQAVRILDEGPFECDVPGAYYFFIQALEDKLSIWMDIVIVFYKHDNTLLRISCLAPSKSMEKFHQLFNDVLISVRFTDGGAPASQETGTDVSQPQPEESAETPAPAEPAERTRGPRGPRGPGASGSTGIVE